MATNPRRYSFIVVRESTESRTLLDYRKFRVSGKPRKYIEPGVFRNLKGLIEPTISTECHV